MTAAAEAVLSPTPQLPSGFAPWITRAFSTLRSLAPYAAIELLLPGGSLIAIILWLYRRRKPSPPTPAADTAHAPSHPAPTTAENRR